MTQENWWQDFYDDAFTDTTGDLETLQDLAYCRDDIISLLRLKSGDRLFDQCCGSARLSRMFHAKGIVVIGVDQSADYIAAARCADPHGEYHVGDGFEFVPSVPCDGAINWWTSFGFFEDDAKNTQMIERLFQSLKSGGYAAIEYANAAFDRKYFRPFSTYTKQLGNGLSLKVERHYTIDEQRGMRGSTWHYSYSDGRTATKYGETRLYRADDISALMRGAGFVDIEVVSTYSDAPITEDTPRFICVGRKPA